MMKKRNITIAFNISDFKNIREVRTLVRKAFKKYKTKFSIGFIVSDGDTIDVSFLGSLPEDDLGILKSIGYVIYYNEETEKLRLKDSLIFFLFLPPVFQIIQLLLYFGTLKYKESYQIRRLRIL